MFHKRKVGVQVEMPEVKENATSYDINYFSFKIIKKILIIKFYINDQKHKMFVHLYNGDYMNFDETAFILTFEHNGYMLNCNTNKLKKNKLLLRISFGWRDSMDFYDLYRNVIPIKRKYHSDVIKKKKKMI